MKKLVLLSLAASISTVSFGQRAKLNPAQAGAKIPYVAAAAKTTSSTDTVQMPLLTTGDTLYCYHADMSSPYDTGFVTGMNAWGDKGFAQRYDVKASDSTVRVLGIITRFHGTVSPTSTNSVNLKVWTEGAKTTWGRPTLFNSGFPDSVKASMTVNVRNLGIKTTSAGYDSIKFNWFATPTPILTKNFFVGYDMTYTWGATSGDTIGLYSTLDRERTAVGYTAYSTTDTTINNYNVTQFSDGTWHDNLYDNFRIAFKLVAVPLVNVYKTTGVSITNNGFTFHGCYPNPASNSTTISFALAAKTDVTVYVMDMNGRIINTIAKQNLASGEQTISVETANLPAGNYVYMISTAQGGSIASTFSVVK